MGWFSLWLPVGPGSEPCQDESAQFYIFLVWKDSFIQEKITQRFVPIFKQGFIQEINTLGVSKDLINPKLSCSASTVNWAELHELTWKHCRSVYFFNVIYTVQFIYFHGSQCYLKLSSHSETKQKFKTVNVRKYCSGSEQSLVACFLPLP